MAWTKNPLVAPSVPARSSGPCAASCTPTSTVSSRRGSPRSTAPPASGAPSDRMFIRHPALTVVPRRPSEPLVLSGLRAQARRVRRSRHARSCRRLAAGYERLAEILANPAAPPPPGTHAKS